MSNEKIMPKHLTLKPTKHSAPPRLLIHGVEGVGKSSFAAQLPNPIFINIEDGLGGIEANAFPVPETFEQVIEQLDAIGEGHYPCDSVVIDSIDWLQELIFEHTARIGGQPDIEAFGYGKGYVKAMDDWSSVLMRLEALRDQGKIVCLLAHSQVKTFNSPITDSYDTYGIKLHKTSAGKLSEWADIVGFAIFEVFTKTEKGGFNKETKKGVGTGKRILHVNERPAFSAKNRYGIEGEIELSVPALMAAIASS